MKRIDYSKLGAFTDRLGDLPPDQVIDVLRAFREGCLSRFPELTLPSRKDQGDAFALIDNPSLRRLGIRTFSNNVLFKLAQVLRTPRHLRRCLRRSRDAWNSVHGEVRFSELVALNALRESERYVGVTLGTETRSISVFDLVVRNIDWLRTNRDEEPPTSETPAESESARSEVQQLHKMMDTSADPEGALIRYIFRGDDHPQSARHAEPSDYFDRLLAEEVTDYPSDAAVVSQFKKMTDDSHPEQSLDATQQLASWLMQEGLGAEKVKQFAGEMTLDEKSHLADATLEQIYRDWPTVVMDLHHPLAFINLSRLYVDGVDRDRRIALVKSFITKAMAKSLALVTAAEYWLVFRPIRDTSIPADPEAVRLQVAELIRAEFFRRFVIAGDTGAARLAEVFEVEVPWTLHWIIRREWDQSELRWMTLQGWRPAASVLIEAAELSPQKVGVGLAVLCMRTEMPHGNWTIDSFGRRSSTREYTFTFETDVVKELFDGFESRLFSVFAGLEPDQFTGELRELVRFAQRVGQEQSRGDLGNDKLNLE